MEEKEWSLFVLGNLLLDMVCPVDESYLERYDLRPDSIQTMDVGKHSGIFDDMLKRPDVTLSPGGSALNTARMAQMILNVPRAITLIGAIGSDDTGKLLISKVEEEGIKMCVQTVQNSSTGTCASLLTRGGCARTMVTDLGAALKFSHEMFVSDKDALGRLDKAKIVYISGYFLKVSPETVMAVAIQAKSKELPIVLNLNATWITTTCKQELMNLLPYTDILIGNESEILSLEFLTSENLKTNRDVFTISKYLSSMKFQQDGEGTMTVIVTRGENSVVLSKHGTVKEYPVQTINKADIVDSTGAGDAFVGGLHTHQYQAQAGFLAYYIQGKCIDDCIRCGIWAAAENLKGIGFSLPSTEALSQFASFYSETRKLNSFE